MATIGYWICYPFAALVRLFYSLTGSYGVSLILFTLVIKLILLPFQMKSKKSMVRMSRMSGKMQEIQKKYANNQMKMQEEMQKLYAEQGVNPMSGCLWSFLPLPILMALYYIIREPIVYFMNFGTRGNGLKVLEAAKEVVTSIGLSWSTTTSGETVRDGIYAQIEIVKHLSDNASNPAVQKFFAENPNWVNVDYHFLGMDLSTVPSDAFAMLKTGITLGAIGLILIPILSAAFQVLTMKITMKGQPMEGAAASSNKMMMWMMPLMSLWIGFTLPAALGVYWIAQSAFSAIQEAILGRFYNTKLEEQENERQRQIDEDRKRRQEEGRKRQEQQRQQVEQKQTLKEKRKAAQEAKEARAKKPSTTEAGRVGDRPYARGRSYKADRYDTDEK
ncbi:YidC/Oxa1 family membrane protein insertase [Dysosmobacter sp. HCP28S3_G4]|uniref:YidC/Oxa1 family membrane protein insertase n=1 Tax=Dysosmobacter sp. HCP28S3_G4 TaxID=3438938 RepID=UPI003F8C20EE|nr:YidC/Oxa1 family membrane protein insertase [Dysosmobacter sp.]